MKLPLAIPLLLLTAPLRAAAPPQPTLPVKETMVDSLALVVVPNSLVVSPDSSRVALLAKAGDTTLADRGVFLGADDSDSVNPANDSAQPKHEPIRLYLDGHSGAAFDSMTIPVFSPDSKHVGFTGLRDKKWHVVLDTKTVTQDGDDIPGVPIVFSPDSAIAVWAVQRGSQFFVTVGDRHWPAIDANNIGTPLFSPDSKHVALAVRRRTAWMLYVDGKPLPLPDPPPARPGRAADTAHLDRFTQLGWRPDSAALAYFAAFAGSGWQCFLQNSDGQFLSASQPFEDALGQAPIFSEDSQDFAFAAENRKAWSIFLDGKPFPASYEQLLPASLNLLTTAPPAAPPAAATNLVVLARSHEHWQLLRDGTPVGDPFDAIIPNTFITSPDHQHFAFAALRNHQTVIVRDGVQLAACDEAAAGTFAFSPDSRHLAYGARNGGIWSACIDGAPGAPLAAFAATPIAFSPDSSRIAYDATITPKSWRLIVGQDAAQASKPFDAFLKGTKVVWRPDGTIVTLAIEKKVAMRIEATP